MKHARPPIDLAQLAVGGTSLLTTQDVARLLRVHPKHVYRLLRRGLPGHRVGGEWRFLAEEVLPWSAARGSTSGSSGRSVDAGATPPFSNVRPSLLAANGDIAVEYLLARMAEGGGPALGLLPADRGSGIERLGRSEVLAAGCHGPEIPDAIDDQRLAFVHLVDARMEF